VARDASNEPVAEVRGVNVHAKQLVDGRDRRQLERLCRYITRPPVAQERLELRADGRIELTLKSIWRDGTRALLFEPHDLLTRLVAAVPAPRFHLLRYFGVLSRHSALRAEVVPKAAADPTQSRPPPAQGDQLSLLDSDDTTERPAPRNRWAWLLAVTLCPADGPARAPVAPVTCQPKP
jgi:Putative transposase